MTKYILHGGQETGKPSTSPLYKEMARDISKKDITVLYVPFTKEDKEKQHIAYELNKKACIKAVPQKKITFLFADTNPQKFLDQMHIADAIFLPGGDNKSLKIFLLQVPLQVLQKHMEGKVIVGTSAGANILSAYYYSNQDDRIEEGLRILPIKVICHYTEEKEPKLQELENYKEHLTSFALPEDYFVVIQ